MTTRRPAARAAAKAASGASSYQTRPLRWMVRAAPADAPPRSARAAEAGGAPEAALPADPEVAISGVPDAVALGAFCSAHPARAATISPSARQRRREVERYEPVEVSLSACGCNAFIVYRGWPTSCGNLLRDFMSGPPSRLHPSGRRSTGVSRRSCRGTFGRRRLGWRGGATAGIGQGRHEHERDQFQAFHTQSYSPCDLDQAKLEDKDSECRRGGQRNTSAVTENDIIVALRSNARHPNPGEPHLRDAPSREPAWRRPAADDAGSRRRSTGVLETA